MRAEEVLSPHDPFVSAQVHHPELAVIRWPGGADELRRARAAGRPALLVVAARETPPALWRHEDWARPTADEAEVLARAAAVCRRAADGHESRPRLDGDGVLRHRDRWAALSAIDARIAHLLLDRLDRTVPAPELEHAGWGDAVPSANALRLRMMRLRRHLEPLGLRVESVRSHGYALRSVTATVQSDFTRETETWHSPSRSMPET